MDLCLEGFPIGSYTANLEVALTERALVRKPWLTLPEVPPVDRGALDGFAAPPAPGSEAERALTRWQSPRLEADLGRSPAMSALSIAA